MALLTPALIGVRLIFKTGGIRAGVKEAGVKIGPTEIVIVVSTIILMNYDKYTDF